MWNRLIEKMKGKSGRRGYTLTEVLVVVAIIAVLCAIALTSFVVISRNLKFRQRNDYAKTIFMAAQQNLSELRSDGSLVTLQMASEGAGKAAAGNSGFPEIGEEDWAAEYYYTDSTDTLVYSMVLPAVSVEADLRNQQVIIEYNPYTGNVYSVFYCEDDDVALLSLYTGDELKRDDMAARKKLMVGYYGGSGLASTEIELEKTAAGITFENGEEGIVTVEIPIPASYFVNVTEDPYTKFASGLVVKLNIRGEISGNTVELYAKAAEDVANCAPSEDGRAVLVTYVLDSLIDYGSFANIAMTGGVTTPVDGSGNVTGATVTNRTHLTTVSNESGFTLLPGENVTIQADVSFSDSLGVEIDPGVLSGVNPLFAYMEPGSADNKYVLAVSNGRNLQNLNVIAPSVASCVETVVFTSGLDEEPGDDTLSWAETAAYYNEKYGRTDADGNDAVYSNSGEAPARCLPYFVPIYNDGLFGSTYFALGGDGATPVLQDAHDAHVENGSIVANDHADIMGEGYKVAGLVIDATKYEAQTAKVSGSRISEYYVTSNNDQTVFYHFTGLFAYVNTNVDGLYVVNPMVKGYCYENADITTATGGLLGTSGYNTLVTNCGIYMDKSDDTFDASAMTGPKAYSASPAQTWYGVTGQGAVGGLVGYAKSHRTASGDLTDDTSELAFVNSFAAVPVSGTMRASPSFGGNTRYFGYTNGVGGFIGNSELTNFYNCYASGDVLASGCYVSSASGNANGGNTSHRPGGGGGLGSDGTTLNEILQYWGKTSMGAGGFVGSSHGTRYTNCFATGDVVATGGSAGAGGFVGIMCYDEGFNYTVSGVTQRITQLTVFDSCYCVGTASINGTKKENFSGANGRIYSYDNTFYPDYYKLLAPYYTRYRTTPKYPEISNSSNEAYDAYYIYKDSYYLDLDRETTSSGVTNTNSNDCASVASYDLLMHLYDYHRDNTTDGWLDQRVEALGLYTTKSGRYYNTAYNWSSLETPYKTQLQEGFPGSRWEAATVSDTHSYSMTGSYPFAMLTDMPYYGDWPTSPLEGGIAYYENYVTADNKTTYHGIYFDTADTSTLLDAETFRTGDYTVTSDGYAILTRNASDRVVVEVEGSSAQFTLTGSSIGGFEPNQENATRSYAVFPLTKAIMDAAADAVAADNYYVRITATVTTTNGKTDEYVMYFNPNAAVAHINPSYGTTAGDPGSGIPALISISTARQLAALGSSNLGWGADYNYLQELDIDFNTYTAESYGSDAAKVMKEVLAGDAIGNSATAFTGTYNGRNGYLTQSAVTLWDTTVYSSFGITDTDRDSLFGNVAAGGSVRNLAVNLGDARIGNTSDDSVGVVFGVLDGTADNVDLSLDGTASVTAKTNAGLMAGTVGGTLANCDATLSGNVTVAADQANAAGAVGSIGADAAVRDCSVTISGTMTARGENAGGFAGTSAGTVSKVKTIITGSVTAQSNTNAGGFAGRVSGGRLTDLSVALKNLSGGEYVGGVVGYTGDIDGSGKPELVSLKSEITGTLSGANAGGLMGHGVKTSVVNSNVTVSGTVSGTKIAAGLAGGISSTSSVNATNVAIASGAAIVSDDIAAGYIAALSGNVTEGEVVLSGGRIQGTKAAAGFGGTISGTVTTDSAVVGRGTITSDGSAAGFAVTVDGTVAGARVTPATAEKADAYADSSNEYLAVSGGTAAGFAGKVIGTVTNCNALGSISGSTVSGFVDTNSGKITGCIANVTLSGGSAFVRTNTGDVNNCYGWYGDGDASTENISVPAAGENYTSCYFVDIDIRTTDTTESVTLFDSGKQRMTMTAMDLINARSALNGDKGKLWHVPGDKAAYPYNIGLGVRYLYPMLRAHCGDWTVAPQYAHGVIYYEQYSDGSLKYRIVELTKPADTLDGQSLSFNEHTFDSSDAITITDAGYALFCRVSADNTNPFGAGYLGDELGIEEISNKVNAYNSAKYYTVYKLNPDKSGVLEFSSDLTVVTWFADAFNTAGTEADPYQVRTASQLANIGKVGSNAYMKQTHNIAADASAFTAVDTLNGTFDGNGCTIRITEPVAVSETFGFIAAKLGGKAVITDVDVAGTISVTPGNETVHVGGLVGETVTGGTISGSTVSGRIALSDGAAAGGAVIGGAVGYDGGASCTGVTASVTVDANLAQPGEVEGVTDPAGNGPVGMFVGYVTGGSFTDCFCTAENVTYQFLGQIEISSGNLPASGDAADWFSSEKETEQEIVNAASGDDLDAVPSANGYALTEDGAAYSGYIAHVENCTFVYGTQTFYQIIRAADFFYLGTTEEIDGGYALNAVSLEASYTGVNNVAYEDLWSTNDGNMPQRTPRATDYYFLSGGTYVRVYVKVTTNRNGQYLYTLTNSNGNTTLLELDGVSGRNLGNSIRDGGRTVTLYTRSITVPNGTYLITDSSETNSFSGSANAVAVTDSDNLVFWTVTNGKWYNGSVYLYLRNSNLTTGYSNNASTIVVSPSSDGSGYLMQGSNYLTYRNGQFGTGSSGSAVKLFTGTPIPASYKYIFDCSDYSNMTCLANTAADGSGTAWAVIVPESEEIENQSETNPTEASEPTEASTETEADSGETGGSVSGG